MLRRLLAILLALSPVAALAARSNATANGNYLEYSGAVVSTTPFSMGVWFNASDTTTAHRLMSIYDTTRTSDYFQLIADGATGGDPVTFVCVAKTAATTTGFSSGTNTYALAVANSSTDRRVYINGGSKGTETSNVTPTGLNATLVASRHSSGGYNTSLLGSAWEAAIWNIALSDADALQLASGVSPLHVHPEALVGYWPLIGQTSPEVDLIAGHNLTVNGFTAAAHGAIVYSGGLRLVAFHHAAAGGGTIQRRTLPGNGTRTGSRQEVLFVLPDVTDQADIPVLGGTR